MFCALCFTKIEQIKQGTEEFAEICKFYLQWSFYILFPLNTEQATWSTLQSRSMGSGLSLIRSFLNTW